MDSKSFPWRMAIASCVLSLFALPSNATAQDSADRPAAVAIFEATSSSPTVVRGTVRIDGEVLRLGMDYRGGLFSCGSDSLTVTSVFSFEEAARGNPERAVQFERLQLHCPFDGPPARSWVDLSCRLDWCPPQLLLQKALISAAKRRERVAIEVAFVDNRARWDSLFGQNYKLEFDFSAADGF